MCSCEVEEEDLAGWTCSEEPPLPGAPRHRHGEADEEASLRILQLDSPFAPADDDETDDADATKSKVWTTNALGELVQVEAAEARRTDKDGGAPLAADANYKEDSKEADEPMPPSPSPKPSWAATPASPNRSLQPRRPTTPRSRAQCVIT